MVVMATNNSKRYEQRTITHMGKQAVKLTCLDCGKGLGAWYKTDGGLWPIALAQAMGKHNSVVHGVK
jgi:hypothetical protein